MHALRAGSAENTPRKDRILDNKVKILEQKCSLIKVRLQGFGLSHLIDSGFKGAQTKGDGTVMLMVANGRFRRN